MNVVRWLFSPRFSPVDVLILAVLSPAQIHVHGTGPTLIVLGLTVAALGVSQIVRGMVEKD
jgi:hypothetical protein